MLGLQKFEMANLDKWHSGYFTETESCTVEGNNLLHVENSNCWIHSKKEKDGSFICSIFRRNNGINYLIMRVKCIQMKFKQYLKVILSDGDILVCNCGCNSFKELPKQRPMEEIMKCLNCGSELHLPELL